MPIDLLNAGLTETYFFNTTSARHSKMKHNKNGACLCMGIIGRNMQCINFFFANYVFNFFVCLVWNRERERYLNLPSVVPLPKCL